MHRFGDQIELRVDRRHLLLFFLGAVFWTLVAFFVGMLVAGEGKVRRGERGLAALGWLDRHATRQLEATRRAAVAFSFARRTPPRARAATAPPHHRAPPARPGDPQPAARPPAPAAPRPAASAARPLPRPRLSPTQPRPRARADVRPAPRRRAAVPPARRTRPGRWTYRIAMRVPIKARAFRLLKRFRRLGYAPIIATIPRGARGRTYRITFGRFARRPRANAVASALKRERIPGRIRVIRVRTKSLK